MSRSIPLVPTLPDDQHLASAAALTTKIREVAKQGIRQTDGADDPRQAAALERCVTLQVGQGELAAAVWETFRDLLRAEAGKGAGYIYSYHAELMNALASYLEAHSYAADRDTDRWEPWDQVVERHLKRQRVL